MIPPEAELTDRPEEIPAWDDMPDDLKPVLARQMEVYAGFLEHTDHHVGRLVDALADLEVLDDTLIYYIVGDNGASAEGTPQGTFNETITLNGAAEIETTEFMAVANRPVRHDRRQQPLRGRLGARDGHALPVDQAGGLALGRHAQRHDRPLAERLHGSRRGARAVQPRDRRGGDGARRGRPARADVRPRRAADAAARQEHGARASTTRPRPSTARRSTSRCSSTAASTTRAGPRSLATASRGCTAESPPIDADVWELYAPDDWTQAHDLAEEQPEKLARAPAPVPDRSGPLQRAAARRPPRRALQRRPRRPPAAHPREVAAPVRGHGPAVGELGARHQEQVTRRHGPDRGARGRRARG